MQDRTSIQIERTTKDRLQKHGKMGDSFDSLINRILDSLEEQSHMDSNESPHEAFVTA